jgi:hypothetical protein
VIYIFIYKILGRNTSRLHAESAAAVHHVGAWHHQQRDE